MAWPWLRDEIADLAEQVATMLRDAPDVSARVDGTEWTVAEVGAHLVDVARRNVTLARDPSPTPFPGSPSETHARRAALNERRLEQLDERDPEKLAAMLVSDNEDVIAAYGADPDASVHWYGVPLPATSAATVWLGELLVHGRDLARTLGSDWVIEPEQALAVIDALVPLLPAVVDPERARRMAGTAYHLRLRPGPEYTFVLDRDGRLRVERARPERADVRLVADPATSLLVGYGRTPTWTAVLSGRIRAWGRRPWLALGFPDLFERP